MLTLMKIWTWSSNMKSTGKVKEIAQYSSRPITIEVAYWTGLVTLWLLYIYSTKKNRYMYIQCIFYLNRNDILQSLFYISMKTSLQSFENEYHGRNLKIKVYRSVWLQAGSKVKNAILRCTLKARTLLMWLTHVSFPFLRYLSDSIW